MNMNTFDVSVRSRSTIEDSKGVAIQMTLGTVNTDLHEHTQWTVLSIAIHPSAGVPVLAIGKRFRMTFTEIDKTEGVEQ